MRTLRWCDRCQAMTEHLVGDGQATRLPWRWSLFWPFVRLIDWLADPALCVACLDRDHPDDDE